MPNQPCCCNWHQGDGVNTFSCEQLQEIFIDHKDPEWGLPPGKVLVGSSEASQKLVATVRHHLHPVNKSLKVYRVAKHHWPREVLKRHRYPSAVLNYDEAGQCGIPHDAVNRLKGEGRSSLYVQAPTRLNAVMSNVIGEQDHTLISPTKKDLMVKENELLVPIFEVCYED